MPLWSVYVARCADDTLYCGIALDVEARLAQHDAGTGARYTRGRGPLQLVAVRRVRTMGRALRVEHAIKRLPRRTKLALVGDPARLDAFMIASARGPQAVRGSARRRRVSVHRAPAGGPR